jgi:serine/threonine protein kinase
MSATCQGVGTTQFVAPEVASGQYGKAVDFWSVGALCLVLRTCKLLAIQPAKEETGDGLSELAYAVWKGQSAHSVLEAHLATGIYGTPSAELVVLLQRLLADSATRGLLSASIIAEDPWFTAGPSASDLEFARWLVARNKTQVESAVAVAPRQLLLDTANTFYASLVGLITKANQWPVQDMVNLLGLKSYLAPLMDLGLDQVKDLPDIEESDLDGIGMPWQAKSQLASAVFAIFGADAPAWCTR